MQFTELQELHSDGPRVGRIYVVRQNIDILPRVAGHDQRLAAFTKLILRIDVVGQRFHVLTGNRVKNRSSRSVVE